MNRSVLFGLFCSLILVIFAAAPVPAAPVPDAPREDVSPPGWHALYLRFEAGQSEAALALIRTHFAPVDSVFGRQLVVLGEENEWDAIIFTRLVRDPSGQTWVANPVPEIWLEALAAREGGMDEALAVLRRFEALIAASESDLIVQSDAPEWAMRVLG